MNPLDSQLSYLQRLIQNKEFRKAEDLLALRMLENPEDADVHYLLGVSFYFQGKIGPAIEELQACLEHNPEHTDASICLSVLYGDIGKYKEAETYYTYANRAVHLQGSHGLENIDLKLAIKHIELGDLYFRFRRFKEARAEYEKAIALHPESFDTQIKLVRVQIKAGELESALTQLTSLRKEHPQSCEVWMQTALAQLHQNQKTEAVETLQHVLRIDPNHREAKKYLELTPQSV